MKLTKITQLIGAFAVVACLGVTGWSHDEPSPFAGTALGTFDIGAGQFSAVLEDEGGVDRYRIVGRIAGNADRDPQGTFRGDLYSIHGGSSSTRIGLVAGLYVEGQNDNATVRAVLLDDAGVVLGSVWGHMNTVYLYGPTPPLAVPLLAGEWMLQ